MRKILVYILIILVTISTVSVQAEEFDLQRIGGAVIEVDLEELESIYNQTIPEIVKDYDIHHRA